MIYEPSSFPVMKHCCPNASKISNKIWKMRITFWTKWKFEKETYRCRKEPLHYSTYLPESNKLTLSISVRKSEEFQKQMWTTHKGRLRITKYPSYMPKKNFLDLNEYQKNHKRNIHSPNFQLKSSLWAWLHNSYSKLFLDND